MSSRGMAFFRLIVHWICLLTSLMGIKGIHWYDIPGYTVLVKSFLSEMRHRDILDYPDDLKKAIDALLVNKNLLTIFVHMVFQRTRIHDYKTIITGLELIFALLSELGFQTGKAERADKLGFGFEVRLLLTITCLSYSFGFLLVCFRSSCALCPVMDISDYILHCRKAIHKN